MQHSLTRATVIRTTATRASSLSALLASLAAFAFSGQAPAQAQTLGTMMFFDGVQPQGGLVTDSVGLYGATSGGGYALGGLLYRLALDTNSVLPLPITTIYEYGQNNVWTGANPGAGLLLSAGNLYGTTRYTSISALNGGINGKGTIFRVSVGGTNYTKLADFEELTVDTARNVIYNTTGATPAAPLIQGTEAGISYLYGTAPFGGANGMGTIFKIRADGVGGIIVLHSFAARTNSPTQTATGTIDTPITNADGSRVAARLHLGTNGDLYGVAPEGGLNQTGTIFAVSTNATAPNFRVLHTFNAIIPGDATATPPIPSSNIDGAYPQSGLIESGGFLYGTTFSYGANGVGNIYRIALDGSAFAIRRSFNITDGANPTGDLILTADGKLAGTTQLGGTLPTDVVGAAAGTVYTLSLDGLSYNQECVFNAANAAFTGSRPQSGVIQVDGNFYGSALEGLYNAGIIFKCGSPHTGPVLGVRPIVNYDDGGGALPTWMLALLAGVLAMQWLRRQRLRWQRRI